MGTAQSSNPADHALRVRAAMLSGRYLGGHARPGSVRWVDTMTGRWGSCTPSAGTIRISRRVEHMPVHVRDYVLLNELTHLLVPGHGPNFWTLMASYPHVDRARGFLEGVDHVHSRDGEGRAPALEGEKSGQSEMSAPG